MADAPLTVPDTRPTRLLIEGIAGGIVAGVSAWASYFGLKQAYRAVVIVLRPELSFAARVGDPAMLALIWLAILLSAVIPIVFGSAGLYATLTRKLWPRLGIEFRAPAGKGGNE